MKIVSYRPSLLQTEKETLNFDPCIPIKANHLPPALCLSAEVLSLNPLYCRFVHCSVCLLYLHLFLFSSLSLQRVFTMTKDFISLHYRILWSPFSSSACLTLCFTPYFFPYQLKRKRTPHPHLHTQCSTAAACANETVDHFSLLWHNVNSITSFLTQTLRNCLWTILILKKKVKSKVFSLH